MSDASTPNMRYMSFLGRVVADGVRLIQEKTRTYGDSWKKRGGPGAWFTVARPIDRLEGIMSRHGGDIFAAIRADPTGKDGSALACVRDIMNYMILIEAEARATMGVESTGPAEIPLGEDAEGPWMIMEIYGERFRISQRMATYIQKYREAWERPARQATPEDGGQHAAQPLEEAGEPSAVAAATYAPRGSPERRAVLETVEPRMRELLVSMGLLNPGDVITVMMNDLPEPHWVVSASMPV